MVPKIDRVKQLETTLAFMLGALASSTEPWIIEARKTGQWVLENPRPLKTCDCSYCEGRNAWVDLGK